MGDGIYVDAEFDTDAGGGEGTVPAISWFVGNTFRGNSISSQFPPVGYLPLTAGILFTATSAGDPAQVLVNVIDQNTITNMATAVAITSHNASGGVVLTVFANNFFSSDGSQGSIGLTMEYPGAYADEDPDSYYLFGSANTWQNFWDEFDLYTP